jgi:hypothetical protein
MGPDEAVEAADHALALYDKKWEASEWVSIVTSGEASALSA